MERPLVSGSQRFAYPQVMRSKRFDSIIVGSSTARLIDPSSSTVRSARASPIWR
jgi:riboflavin biosynthesis pyrimidine reductase